MNKHLPRLLTALCLLAAPCAHAAAPLNWTGLGSTGNASEPENWSAGRLPGVKDSVVFGPRSSRDCYWDIDATVAAFTVTEKFHGDIRFGAPLTVTGDMTVRGGMLYLRTATLTVGRRLSVVRKGLFEMANGTLKVGRQGILVDKGGTFFSRGDAKASIGPAKPGEYYGFTVKRGSLVLSNPAGTEVGGSSGLAVGSGARVKRADFVEIKDLKPGATALKVSGSAGRGLRPNSWTFDETVKNKISARSRKQKAQALAAMSVPRPELTPVEAPVLVSSAAAPAEIAAAVPEEPQGEPFAGLDEYEAASAKSKLQPYLAVRFSGGQHFFAGQEGDLAGNLNVLASMAIKHEKLGPKLTLVPVLSSQYQGTKQVTDLVGGGTLFQEKMSHSVAVRSVYQLTPKWKLKPSLGYKWEFLKETRDESWGEGLFDYHRPGFSLEGEYAYRDPFSFTIGYDFYKIGFVNFVSLESIIQDSSGNSMARELAGAAVLDSYNHAFSFGGTAEGAWRTYAEGNLTTTLRFFPDQHVVGGTGDYRNSTRRDLSTQFSLAWRMPRQLAPGWKAVGGLRAAAGYNASNQNSYDAQRLKFLKNYYDSVSVRAGVDLSLSRAMAPRYGDKEGRTLDLSLSATVGRIGYSGRQAQAESGLYLGDKIYQNEQMLSVGVSYPIAPHFVWTSQFGFGRQTSNQRFEKLYRYNFTTTNYRIGFGYEY
ncbi:MAG TPA: hypothetical protein DEQ38_09135 [Elusimicrobia bacterium]|nr:MAG: hypothetical protein A2089_01485 [Elusimicrobia bacterium GWD2_63_28]HCC48258.1 hypothetical protein [Elusimicrobiota bacterium]